MSGVKFAMAFAGTITVVLSVHYHLRRD